jgi:hypothetical protein
MVNDKLDWGKINNSVSFEYEDNRSSQSFLFTKGVFWLNQERTKIVGGVFRYTKVAVTGDLHHR